MIEVEFNLYLFSDYFKHKNAEIAKSEDRASTPLYGNLCTGYCTLSIGMYGRLSSAPCLHVAPLPSRALSAVEGSRERHRFLVGTAEVADLNQVQLLEYSEDKNRLEVVASLSHPHQIHRLVSSKTDESLLLTSSTSSQGVHELCLLKLPEEKLSTSVAEQEFSLDPIDFDRSTVLCSSSESGSLMSAMQWHPLRPSQLLVQTKSSLRLCSMGDQTFKARHPSLIPLSSESK